MSKDAGLEAVRKVRHKISRQYGNDPARLIEHYMDVQERYKERLRPGPEALKATEKTK